MKGQKGFVGVNQAPAQAFSLKSLLALAAARALRWLELARQRRELASMSEAALKDIGLSRADILQETERHFWEDPLKK
jgi:uncharacterized protein YjiS (DUF1127 family)